MNLCKLRWSRIERPLPGTARGARIADNAPPGATIQGLASGRAAPGGADSLLNDDLAFARTHRTDYRRRGKTRFMKERQDLIGDGRGTRNQQAAAGLRVGQEFTLPIGHAVGESQRVRRRQANCDRMPR